MQATWRLRNFIRPYWQWALLAQRGFYYQLCTSQFRTTGRRNGANGSGNGQVHAALAPVVAAE